jgi:NAD(P)-dependent dehydrogenase (short-subunit alcohol dehydrogenase family)
VNFCGAAATLTAALGGMLARRRGHLVGVGSISAYGALPGSAAYCTPKAGLTMLLDCLRLDLLGSGVHVTHVRLGFVRTAMVAHSTHRMPQLLEPGPLADEIAARLPSAPREIVLPRALAAATRIVAAAPAPLRELVLRAVRAVR